MVISDLTNEQLLARIKSIAREVNSAGKPGMGAEKARAVLVREAERRELLGMKLKKKYREI